MRFAFKIAAAFVIAVLIFTIIWVDRQKSQVEELRQQMIRPAASIEDAFQGLDRAEQLHDSVELKTLVRPID
ncbi:MAG: hypothetical protein QM754_02345 [Tepidisphaeraceae bacterium]